MAIDVRKTLRKALTELQAEREKIDQQIAAIESALAGLGGKPRHGGGRVARPQTAVRRSMSTAARKALSRRMNAYWAKRREQAAKVKGKGGK